MMKKLILSLLLSLWFAAAALAQKGAKKAVFIIVDGIPADVVEKIATPHLDTIAAAGSYRRAYVGGEKDGYSQTPTISAVSYNSLLTGTWVNKHNVWDNSIKNPNYNYWSIFRLYKEQYPKGKTAIFSSWTDNRTKLVGEGLKQTGNIQLDYRFDGYELDTVRFAHDRQRAFMHRIDETVTADAVACIETKAPDLSWVYLEYTDDMGHMYGDSPQFYDAVEKMDKQIGRIWAAIRNRQKKFGEDWLILITTDHGRDEKTGKGHGGQSPRQRSTWMITNQKTLNAYARYSQPAIVDAFPTIARFMNVRIAKEAEIDGVPLTGAISLAHPKAVYVHSEKQIDLSWQAYATRGTVKLWLATANNKKAGGEDSYQLVGEVPAADQHFLLDVKDRPSDFYKIIVEGEHNAVNRWIDLTTKE
ncbi:MAG TPA: alkaline phosphatase family protein [Flavisolibacter sp.]|nr:alkaline phosphatase family protein [Flavisolibacter sp.]